MTHSKKKNYNPCMCEWRAVQSFFFFLSLSRQSSRKEKNKKIYPRCAIGIRIKKRTVHVIWTGLDTSKMPNHWADRVRRQ